QEPRPRPGPPLRDGVPGAAAPGPVSGGGGGGARPARARGAGDRGGRQSPGLKSNMSSETGSGRDTGGLRALLRAEAPVLVPLALAVLAATSYFAGPPAWNQNSRLALTRALVEQGTTVIDDHHATTGDKSRRDGHFYSDKAPGT